MRTCSKCLITYQDVSSNFYLSTRDGYLKICKACKKRKHKETYNNIPAKITTKSCFKCEKVYTNVAENFQINKKNVDGYHGVCKICRSGVERARRNGDKRQQILDKKKTDWKINCEKRRQAKRLHYKLNRERLLQEKAEWKKKHPDIVNEIIARRRAHQRLATPKWADKEACRAFYKKAKELTEKTGIEYVVDHIDPLISNLVYGLHCENNLQVITRFDNTFKSNHFIPYRIDASGEKHFLF